MYDIYYNDIMGRRPWQVDDGGGNFGRNVSYRYIYKYYKVIVNIHQQLPVGRRDGNRQAEIIAEWSESQRSLCSDRYSSIIIYTG